MDSNLKNWDERLKNKKKTSNNETNNSTEAKLNK